MKWRKIIWAIIHRPKERTELLKRKRSQPRNKKRHQELKNCAHEARRGTIAAARRYRGIDSPPAERLPAKPLGRNGKANERLEGKGEKRAVRRKCYIVEREENERKKRERGEERKRRKNSVETLWEKRRRLPQSRVENLITGEKCMECLSGFSGGVVFSILRMALNGDFKTISI